MMHHVHLMLRFLLAHWEQELVEEQMNEMAREAGLKTVWLLHQHLELVLVQVLVQKPHVF
jgi:hypothetical protein